MVEQVEDTEAAIGSLRSGYRAQLVRQDLDRLMKCDDPGVVHDTLLAWADGPDDLRKSIATSFIAKAQEAVKQNPKSAIAKWSKPGAVAQGLVPDTAPMALPTQVAQHHKAADEHAKRFAGALTQAAKWGASLGAAAAGARANAGRGLQPRNPVTGAVTAPTICPTCGQRVPMEATKLRKMAVATDPVTSTPRTCPTCGQPVGLQPKNSLTGATVSPTGAAQLMKASLGRIFGQTVQSAEAIAHSRPPGPHIQAERTPSPRLAAPRMNAPGRMAPAAPKPGGMRRRGAMLGVAAAAGGAGAYKAASDKRKSRWSKTRATMAAMAKADENADVLEENPPGSLEVLAKAFDDAGLGRRRAGG